MANIDEILINQISQEVLPWLEKINMAKTKEQLWANVGASRKDDKSVVTDFDLRMSSLTREVLGDSGRLDLASFICEETSLPADEVSFPCFVLDPIDGTRELAQGRDEWSYSLAYMHSTQLSDPKNQAWVFAPATGFSLKDSDLYPKADTSPIIDGPWLGLISRTEWEKNKETFNLSSSVICAPRGSIALKLAMLAAGSCDFVFTSRAKNIWDIAAGSVLCMRRDIRLFNRDGEISQLDCKLIEGPLLWCRPAAFDALKKIFF